MLIRTSSFADSKGEPGQISIARHAPDWWSGPSYATLAPRPEWLKLSQGACTPLYAALLAKLDAKRVIEELTVLAGDNIMLLCWEASLACRTGRAWCHRHLVARWLERETGILVLEFALPRSGLF
jgi:hypothetical protein